MRNTLISSLIFIIMCGSAFGQEVDTTKAVIHHTASHDVSVWTINKWHKARGFNEIGYHYLIRKNGTIEKGRDINKKGAHAKGRNHYIGIALTGYDKFTDAQILALKSLIQQLNIKKVERHHENCPSKGLDIEGLQKSISLQNVKR